MAIHTIILETTHTHTHTHKIMSNDYWIQIYSSMKFHAVIQAYLSIHARERERKRGVSMQIPQFAVY